MNPAFGFHVSNCAVNAKRGNVWMEVVLFCYIKSLPSNILIPLVQGTSQDLFLLYVSRLSLGRRVTLASNVAQCPAIDAKQ